MGVPDPKKVRTTKIILTIVGSQPRYSAIPPQTPEIIRSVCDFLKRAPIKYISWFRVVADSYYGKLIVMFQLILNLNKRKVQNNKRER